MNYNSKTGGRYGQSMGQCQTGANPTGGKRRQIDLEIKIELCTDQEHSKEHRRFKKTERIRKPRKKARWIRVKMITLEFRQ